MSNETGGSSGIDSGLIAAAREDATRLSQGVSDRFDRVLLESGERSHRLPQLPDYEILREAHRGAQGVVFEARQRATGRRVAVKVLRSGPWVGRSDAARFEREIRVLGLLRHEGIVSVLDGGVADGSAYLVMDFIDGPPLDEFVRASIVAPAGGNPKRGAERRRLNRLLDLFAAVCEAVGAAHLRGVIHRDLKPANIRVDASGRPLVLDFGLAKLLDEDTVDFRAAEATQAGQFVGSLPWTSPEQAEGAVERVDMRSDVYSLGVILYHLLTGAFPYQTVGTLRDTLDTIVRTAPTPPRRAGGTQPFPIDGELETIVLKCLSKDPNRRYLTAADLARDVRRYRGGQPIEAKRDSGWYMFKKAVARHRIASVSLFVLLVVMLLAFAAVTFAWQRAQRERQAAEMARAMAHQAADQAETQRALAESLAAAEALQRARAEQLAGEAQSERDRAMSAERNAASERQRAEYEARRAAATAEFLQQVLASADPLGDAPARPQVTVREVLDKASERIENQFKSDPAVEGRVREALAKSYESLGAFDAARQQLEATLARSTETLGTDHPATLHAQTQLAQIARVQGRLAEAEAMYRDALGRARRILPVSDPKIATVQIGLVGVLRDRAVLEDAEPLAREALEIRRTALGAGSADTAEAAGTLGWVLADLGRDDEAGALLRQASETYARTLGEDHPRTLGGYSDLGWFLMRTPDFAEAGRLFEHVADSVRRTMGEESVQYSDALNGIGAARRLAGDLAEAEQVYADVLTRTEKVFGTEHPRIALVLDSLAWVRIELAEFEEAEPAARRALEIRRTVLGEDHLHTYFSKRTLATILQKRGATDEAELLLRAACEGFVRLKGAEDPAAKAAFDALVILYQQTGRPEEAEELLRQLAGPTEPQP